MKKIISYIISLILLVSLNQCVGYKPMFGSTEFQFEIAEYSIKGNNKIGNKIHSKLHGLSKSSKNNRNLKKVKVEIDSSEKKVSTSKDSSGKILEYKIFLEAKIRIVDFMSGEDLVNNNFLNSTTYKVQEQYSDTFRLENEAIENLINTTYQKILLIISQNLK